jgi:predicted phage tail protein
MIEKYQAWFDQDKAAIRSICLSLYKFVRFMTKDHNDIVVYRTGSHERTFEKEKQQSQSNFTLVLSKHILESYME